MVRRRSQYHHVRVSLEQPSIFMATTKQELTLIARRHGLDLRYTGGQQPLLPARNNSRIDAWRPEARAEGGVASVQPTADADQRGGAHALVVAQPSPMRDGAERGPPPTGSRPLPRRGALSQEAEASTRARLGGVEFKMASIDWASERSSARESFMRRFEEELRQEEYEKLSAAAVKLQTALRGRQSRDSTTAFVAATRAAKRQWAAGCITVRWRYCLRHRYGPMFEDVVVAHCAHLLRS